VATEDSWRLLGLGWQWRDMETLAQTAAGIMVQKVALDLSPAFVHLYQHLRSRPAMHIVHTPKVGGNQIPAGLWNGDSVDVAASSALALEVVDTDIAGTTGHGEDVVDVALAAGVLAWSSGTADYADNVESAL